MSTHAGGLIVEGLQVEAAAHGQAVPIVRGVSFQVRPGEVLGIVGESGSGKSMTSLACLRLLPKAVRMTGGSIRLGGTELTGLASEEMNRIRGNRICMIMQNPHSSFNPVRTIGAHLLETIRVHLHVKGRAARELAVHYLEQVNLPAPAALLKQYPFQLSGGMLQRVMIAMSIMTEPELLIADEPTTALDTSNQKRVLEELARISERLNTAVMLITHDLGVIAALADHVAVMRQGEIVESAPVGQLFDQPQHPYTRSLLNSRIPHESAGGSRGGAL